MGVIHVLEDKVADQIAAGEVVERPASVVKELVENALDAHAKRILVMVAGGGIERLRIVDDGVGMAADDAVLCFSRHATSKLSRADDLRAIRTFGFRGEALAAIASVSRVSLTTRQAQADHAAIVKLEGGRVAHVGDAAGAFGTTIDVDDLFFNVPARRKFLKAPRTEVAHVEDVLLDAALAEPSVAFQLYVEGKLVLDAPAVAADAGLDDAKRIERALLCLGQQVRPFLYPFSAATDLIQLQGYVVAPLETRRDMAGIHLSVNGRPVSDRGLLNAIRTAFRTLLEVGRQPLVALNIRIAPDEVDVNVHPRKAEVRFVDPRRVSGHIISLLSEFLSTTPWLKAQPPRVYSMARELSARDGSEQQPPVHVDSVPQAGNDNSPATPTEQPTDPYRNRISEALARFADKQAATDRSGFVVRQPITATARGEPLLPMAGIGEAGHFSSLRVVGQVGGTFLILQGPSGMTVIDQHAAHERVVFERLRERRKDGQRRSQPLLIPLQMELSAIESTALLDESVNALLAQAGLVVEPFGARTALVKAVPEGLDGRRAERMVRDALFELADGDTRALDEREDALCARLACHAAIRAGDAMSAESMRVLLKDLDAIDLGAHCPHGRPVVRTISFEEMAQWFSRH